MTKAQIRLADYMAGTTVFDWGYRTKWVLVLTHFILQVALCTMIYFYFGKPIINHPIYAVFTVAVAFGVFAGVFLTIAIVPWMAKAIRVHAAITILGQDGAEDALCELLKVGKTRFSSKEIVFGDRFVFFFQSGAVLAYEDIIRLYYFKAPSIVIEVKKHTLAAETSKGKIFILMWEKIYGVKPIKTKPMSEYINILLSHNPGIIMDSKGRVY